MHIEVTRNNKESSVLSSIVTYPPFQLPLLPTLSTFYSLPFQPFVMIWSHSQYEFLPVALHLSVLSNVVFLEALHHGHVIFERHGIFDVAWYLIQVDEEN